MGGGMHRAGTGRLPASPAHIPTPPARIPVTPAPLSVIPAQAGTRATSSVSTRRTHAPTSAPRKFNPSPLSGGRLGGGWDAPSGHRPSARLASTHPHPSSTHSRPSSTHPRPSSTHLRLASTHPRPSDTHPRHPCAPFRHPCAPFRHSCVGRNDGSANTPYGSETASNRTAANFSSGSFERASNASLAARLGLLSAAQAGPQ